MKMLSKDSIENQDHHLVHRSVKWLSWTNIIGFIILLILTAPFTMLIFGQNLMCLMIGPGIIIWMISAKVAQRSFFNPTVLGITLPIVLLLCLFGYYSPRVSWLPCPYWIPRDVVKRSDYKLMQNIFAKPLPKSFQITQIKYPGDSSLPSPDGPMPAGYEIVVNANDFLSMLQGTAKEDETTGSWPNNSWLMIRMKDFNNDLASDFWEGKTDEQKLKDSLDVYKLPRKHTVVDIAVDDRTSPTLKVYISTRLPFLSD